MEMVECRLFVDPRVRPRASLAVSLRSLRLRPKVKHFVVDVHFVCTCVCSVVSFVFSVSLCRMDRSIKRDGVCGDVCVCVCFVCWKKSIIRTSCVIMFVRFKNEN